MKRWHFLFSLILLLALTGCSSERETTSATKQAETVAVQLTSAVSFVDALGNTHEFTSIPTSVATLNPGILDILLKLEANVVGRPTISAPMSEDVAHIREIGNPHEPSFEQIVALQPDILIVPTNFQRFAQTIESTGIQVIYEEMNSITQIEQVIARYGELFAQQELATTLLAAIEEAKEQTIAASKHALIVYGAPGTYLAALDTSLYGDMLRTIGGKNIAADLPSLDQYPTFASLSAEKIVEGNPQIVLLITHSDAAKVQSGFEKQMNENAAWKHVDAVKNGQIVMLPSELFDNPGTQIVEALAYMRALLEQADKTN